MIIPNLYILHAMAHAADDGLENEMSFKDRAAPITAKLIRKVLPAVCRIHLAKGCGTGFFCALPNDDEGFARPGLFTNNHVLSQTVLSSGKPVNCDIEGKELSLIINKYFTCPELDVSFVEVNKDQYKEITTKQGSFLKLEDDASLAKYQTIFIVQHPRGGDLSLASGIIVDFRGEMDFDHDVATEFGSSGSPVVDTYGNVIGIHKKRDSKLLVNIAVRMTCVAQAVASYFSGMSITSVANPTSEMAKFSSKTPESDGHETRATVAKTAAAAKPVMVKAPSVSEEISAVVTEARGSTQAKSRDVGQGHVKAAVATGCGPQKSPNDSATEQKYYFSSNHGVKFDQSTALATYWSADSSVAMIIADSSFSSECPYFEIEIVSTGQKGTITIGAVPRNYPADNQPGWRPGSIGYHADDGGIFVDGKILKNAETCTVGDIMRCGLVPIDSYKCRVYFTKNQKLVFSVPEFNAGMSSLYSAVGLHSRDEAARLLNQEPWKSSSSR